MHDWSDNTIDWKGISDAASYIASNLRRWGRVPVSDFKEKYGTVRVYCHFGWSSLHDLTHPGWHYIQYREPLRTLYFKSYRVQWFVFNLVNYAVRPYHKWLYTYVYGRAIKKWPHLREEILGGADWSELLTKYGIHRVQTGERSYTIYQDWHPDNYSARNPPTKEEEVEDGSIQEIQH